MAKYDITFSCGHEGTICLTGPHTMREWRIKKEEENGLCPACEEIRNAQLKAERLEQIAKQNAESAAKSAELELPELTGSEKQVAWANTIRLEILEKLEELAKHVRNEEGKAIFMEYVEYVASQTEARWFIDARNYGTTYWKSAVNVWAAKRAEEKKSEAENEQEQEALEETKEVIAPEEATKVGVAELEVVVGDKSTMMTAKYVKDDDFIGICKSLGFKWSTSHSVWARKATEHNGGLDRLVELGHKLLAKGFTIKADNRLTEKMRSADYKPECKRWVKGGEGFYLDWERYTKESDRLYTESKKIPTAHWSDGVMAVSPAAFREIRDFAELNGFCIDEAAERKMKEAEKLESSAKKVSVAAPEKKEEKSKEEKLAEILNSSREIIEDLTDDD